MQKISRIFTHLSASKRKSRTGLIISPTFFLAISTPSAPKNPSLHRRELAGARLLFQKEGDVIYHAADSRHSRILPGFGLRGPLAKYGSPLSRRVFWPFPDLSPTNIPLPHVNSALPRCQEPSRVHWRQSRPVIYHPRLVGTNRSFSLAEIDTCVSYHPVHHF